MNTATPLEEEMSKRAEGEIENLICNQPKTKKMWDMLKDDPFLNGLWEMSDYIAVKKMHYNAHGDTHAKVVAANALAILHIMFRKGVPIDTVKDGVGDIDDAHLIIMTGSLLHDIGNQIDRADHCCYGVILAVPFLDQLLQSIYSDALEVAMVRGSILHCIGSHMETIKSYTMEASIVKIADGTDMTKCRSRLPWDPDNVNIHSVSACSICDVEISEGANKPVKISVHMTNSAGVYQVQEILWAKLKAGVADAYVEIEADTIPKIQTEKLADERIIDKIVVEGGRFVHLKGKT